MAGRRGRWVVSRTNPGCELMLISHSGVPSQHAHIDDTLFIGCLSDGETVRQFHMNSSSIDGGFPMFLQHDASSCVQH